MANGIVDEFGLEADKIKWLPRGVDLDIFTLAESNEEYKDET